LQLVRKQRRALKETRLRVDASEVHEEVNEGHCDSRDDTEVDDFGRGVHFFRQAR